MNDNIPTMTMLASEYNQLKKERLRFDNGFYSDVSAILANIDSFLEKCNQKLEASGKLKSSGKLKLFRYIEFAQQFEIAILPMIRPTKKVEVDFAPLVISTSPPVRSPDYHGRSRLVAFAELLGLSVDQTVYNSNSYYTHKTNPPSYSDPHVLENLAKLHESGRGTSSEGGMNVIEK